MAANQKILALEQAMESMPDLQLRLEARHYFANGLYARELSIPAGCLLTGKIHRTEHLNIVSQGRILVATGNEEAREVSAPHTFVAPAGTKRVGLAIEDTVWTTIHATKETDLEKLEAELIAPTFEALEHSETVSWVKRLLRWRNN